VQVGRRHQAPSETVAKVGLMQSVGRPKYRRPTQRTLAVSSFLAAIGLMVTLIVAPVSVSAAPPPRPSDQQIAAAKAEKAQLGNQVGQLSAQVSALQAKLDQLRSSAELAEQKVALTIEQVQQAQAAAATAQTHVKQAQAAIDTARDNFRQFIRATYMNGPATGMTAELFTATDPQALLQHNDYIHYTATHQITALSSLNRAGVGKSNADAAARGAVLKEQQAKANAETAKRNADAAATAAAKQTQSVAASLASRQNQLDAAQATLASLNNQRAKYDAYVKEQARLKLVAQQRAAAAAAAARNQHNAGNGNGGGVSVAPNPTGGWSPAVGQTAVNRAMAYLNWPYSFAAGNFNGPTYGVPVDYDSRNDARVYGFDCSGLTLYAWAPYIHMTHYAATQYWQAGSVHPNISSLMPGDLVFWSSDGSVSGIGHVAIYIGNGNVIQAPYSGAYLEITPIDQVENGYYGATRPLT
jgi:cell wall-associated NlpC family hydrolase